MVWNAPIPSWEAMGLPRSQLYGNPQTIPSPLNDQGAPKHNESHRSWARKRIKAQSSFPEQFAWCSPSMPAPTPCLLEAQCGHADLFPCLPLQGNPAMLGQGRVPKQAGPQRGHTTWCWHSSNSARGTEGQHLTSRTARSPWLTLTQAPGYTTALC